MKLTAEATEAAVALAAREYWARRPHVMRVESYTEMCRLWDEELAPEVRAWYIELIRPVVVAALRAL